MLLLFFFSCIGNETEEVVATSKRLHGFSDVMRFNVLIDLFSQAIFYLS